MGEITNVLKGSVNIKYSDVYNLKELYQHIREWLLENSYIADGGEQSDKWMETYYYENISQLSGKDYVIYWRTKKPSKSQFVLYYLNIDFRVLAMKDVETTFKGKKVRANKGEVEIIINGFMEHDPAGIFSKDWFMEKILPFFKKRMYKTNLEEIKKDLIVDIKELQEKIKVFLEMRSSIDFEPFKPKRGL